MKIFFADFRRLIWICVTACLLVSCSGKPPISMPSPTFVAQPSTTSLPIPTIQQPPPRPNTNTLPAPSQIALLGKGEIIDVVWSPDRKMFAVASPLGVYVYDGQTRKQIKQIPYSTPYHMKFSPDGNSLVIDGLQPQQLVDLTTGQVILGKDPDHQINGFATFSPDSTILALQKFNGEGIDIYDLKTLNLRHEIRGRAGQEHNFVDTQISPDSHWLATIDQTENKIILWDLQGNVEQLAIRQQMPTSVAFSPDSHWLVSASEDASIRFWSVPNGQLLRTITGVKGGGYQLGFSCDGQCLQLDYGNSYRLLLDAQTGQQIQVINENYMGAATDPSYDFLGLDGFQQGNPAFSPDGKSLAMVSSQKAVIWDLVGQRPERVVRLEDIPDYLVTYSFSPAGSSLALEKDGTLVHQLSLATEAILKSLEENQRTAVAISPDGNTLATAGKEVVELWNINSQARLWQLDTPLEWITELYFSPTGDTLTAIVADRGDIPSQKRAHLIDIRTGTDQNQLDLFPDTFHSRLVAVNGRWIATYLEDDQATQPIRVVDLATGKPLPQLEGAGPAIVGGVYDFRFSPDGRLLALLRHNHLFIWSTATGDLLFEYPRPADGCSPSMEEISLSGLAFSPNADTLAISYESQQVAIWDIRSLLESAPPLTNDLIKSLPPAPTPTPTLTLPSDILLNKCLTIDSNVSSWSLPSGFLLLDVVTGYGSPVLLNLKDRTLLDLQANLDQYSIFNAATSPNGKWIALDLYDFYGTHIQA